MRDFGGRFEIGVAAFNRDMEDTTFEHLGEWTHLTPLTGWGIEIAIFLLVASFVVGVLSMGIACSRVGHAVQGGAGEQIEMNEL